MKYYAALIIGLAGLWLLLSGIYDNTLLMGFGVFSVLLTVYLAGRLGIVDSEGVPVDVFPGILFYWLWLLVEIGKANIVVAKAALSPELKLKPKMFMVDAHPETDLGSTILANSITLTPGTVSIDLYQGKILVHALTEELADPSGINEMSRRIRALKGASTPVKNKKNEQGEGA